jgi:predicted RNase H-like HicB family nuclease
VLTEEDLEDQRVAAGYLHTALARAEYKILEDGTVFGSIPGFQGVWADEKTFTACHTELESALQDWVNYRLANGLDLPELSDTPTPVTLVAA